MSWKICYGCNRMRDLTEFHANSSTKDGRTTRCKDCISKYRGRKYKEDASYRHRQLASSRGIMRSAAGRAMVLKAYGCIDAAVDRIEEILRETRNCEICGKLLIGKDHSLDHDHVTGKLRGSLCRNCNSGLGLFQDDPEVLRKAIEYLKKYEELPGA